MEPRCRDLSETFTDWILRNRFQGCGRALPRSQGSPAPAQPAGQPWAVLCNPVGVALRLDVTKASVPQLGLRFAARDEGKGPRSKQNGYSSDNPKPHGRGALRRGVHLG